MKVTFYKKTEKRLSYWEALRGRRSKLPGSTMALGRGDMPHDLKQLIVEATVGLQDGFWGSIDQGATFRSTGRKRTRPGKAVIATNRSALGHAEEITGQQLKMWEAGEENAVAAALDRVNQAWESLPDEGSLTLVWPTLELLAITEATGLK